MTKTKKQEPKNKNEQISINKKQERKNKNEENDEETIMTNKQAKIKILFINF